MPLPPLCAHPVGRPWPSRSWPLGEPVGLAEPNRLDELTTGVVDTQPAPLGATLALLVVQGGALVSEAYGAGVDASAPLLSWSIAKSVVHAAVGACVMDGLVALDEPAPIAHWSNDDRGRITIRDLLAMRSGLSWREDYVDGHASDVIRMLFGRGEADVAAFAADLPLAAAPDGHFVYSSGTSNILAAVLGERLGGPVQVERFLRDRIFDPLGMSSAVPRFDSSGTWIGSTYLYATARDFARFGLLYARDGVWDGQRILPNGWVDNARRTLSIDPDGVEGYGHHWWTMRDADGSFAATGFEGQRILVVPERDLVIVRMGKTPADLGTAWKDHLIEIAQLFPRV